MLTPLFWCVHIIVLCLLWWEWRHNVLLYALVLLFFEEFTVSPFRFVWGILFDSLIGYTLFFNGSTFWPFGYGLSGLFCLACHLWATSHDYYSFVLLKCIIYGQWHCNSRTPLGPLNALKCAYYFKTWLMYVHLFADLHVYFVRLNFQSLSLTGVVMRCKQYGYMWSALSSFCSVV